jgi:glutaredoxin-like protein NrdH
MELVHVEGKKKGEIVLYALSTCGWCKKAKTLLNELGVDYSFVYVDLLPEPEKVEVVKVIEKWNPDCSFPTMVIDDKKCIVGFKPDEIAKVAL